MKTTTNVSVILRNTKGYRDLFPMTERDRHVRDVTSQVLQYELGLRETEIAELKANLKAARKDIRQERANAEACGREALHAAETQAARREGQLLVEVERQKGKLALATQAKKTLLWLIEAGFTPYSEYPRLARLATGKLANKPKLLEVEAVPQGEAPGSPELPAGGASHGEAVAPALASEAQDLPATPAHPAGQMPELKEAIKELNQPLKFFAQMFYYCWGGLAPATTIFVLIGAVGLVYLGAQWRISAIESTAAVHSEQNKQIPELRERVNTLNANLSNTTRELNNTKLGKERAETLAGTLTINLAGEQEEAKEEIAKLRAEISELEKGDKDKLVGEAARLAKDNVQLKAEKKDADGAVSQLQVEVKTLKDKLSMTERERDEAVEEERHAIDHVTKLEGKLDNYALLEAFVRDVTKELEPFLLNLDKMAVQKKFEAYWDHRGKFLTAYRSAFSTSRTLLRGLPASEMRMPDPFSPR